MPINLGSLNTAFLKAGNSDSGQTIYKLKYDIIIHDHELKTNL